MSSCSLGNGWERAAASAWSGLRGPSDSQRLFPLLRHPPHLAFPSCLTHLAQMQARAPSVPREHHQPKPAALAGLCELPGALGMRAPREGRGPDPGSPGLWHSWRVGSLCPYRPFFVLVSRHSSPHPPPPPLATTLQPQAPNPQPPALVPSPRSRPHFPSVQVWVECFCD